MLRLRKVKKGDPILAEHFNLLIDAIWERTPLSFYNGLLTRTPQGFHVRGNRGGSGGGTSATPLPWDLAVVTDGPSVKVRVAVPSSINGFVPSNVFADFSISATGLYYVKLVCGTNGRVITSVNIVIDSSPPATQTPTMSILPSAFQHTIGLVRDSTAFNVARKVLSATSTMIFRTDKNTPAGPGEMAFAEWYRWEIA